MGLFPLLSTSKMPGVTVKDVNQQEFVRALAAFLKKSGKLKVPDWVDLVKLGKHKELAPSDENFLHQSRVHSPPPVPSWRCWCWLHDQDLWKSPEERRVPCPLQRRIQECGS